MRQLSIQVTIYEVNHYRSQGTLYYGGTLCKILYYNSIS